MQVTTIKRAATLFSLSSLIALTMNAVPANAKGGSATGTGEVPVVTGSTTSSAFKLNNLRAAYNGVVPTGSVTIGYDASGVADTLTISLGKVNVPDGTVLPLRSISGRQTIITTSYYSTYGNVYTEIDGSITVSKGSATLLLSRAKGDVIPNFPLPTVIGTSEIQITDPSGVNILDGTQGSFRP